MYIEQIWIINNSEAGDQIKSNKEGHENKSNEKQ